MPLQTTFLAFTAASLGWPVFAVVATAPSDTSVYAVLGALPAAVCTLLGAQTSHKSRGEQATIFIGSGAIGSIAPDATVSILLYQGTLKQDMSLSWAVWAALGFVAGMSGWGIMQGTLTLWTRYVLRFFSRLLPTDSNKDS